MNHKTLLNRLTPAGVLIALGIVFGDIGTSPLYVMKSITAPDTLHQVPIHAIRVLGGLSCVFWTLTFMTTIKYVVLTLRADNRGEGGILSLYALVRRKAKWLVLPAILGASALLADGFITPPISVTSAVEGLLIKWPSIPVVPIVITIIVVLFVFQRFGTRVVGNFFGPMMLIWFSMLAVLGIKEIFQYPAVLAAINPWYTIQFLREPGGFWLLGSVFLCTTGAEALYSDLGHVGRKNIQGTWAFVKTCLLLNYFGQGAWLMANQGTILGDRNPFFYMMPHWFLLPGIFIATAATIIASQALITGSYTLISEAIRLNVWPKVKINYPTIQRGQVYIPSINLLLCLGCIGVVLYFRESSKMEGAYGLAITLTMLVTTVLLKFYMRVKRYPPVLAWTLFFIFLTIELSFLTANLDKFPHGGFVTLLIATALVFVMWTWFKARKIKNRYVEFVKLDKHLTMLKELSEDQSIPKYATNLVFLTSADFPNEIEQKIIYSIFNKQPKRADVYYFVHIDVLDEPHTREYKIDYLVPEKVIKVEFKLGFRVAPRVNLFFRKVVEELFRSKEVDIMSRYNSLRRHDIVGDFRFVVIERILNADYQLKGYEKFLMTVYQLLKDISLSEEKAFGLDTSLVTTEKVPLISTYADELSLHRIK